MNPLQPAFIVGANRPNAGRTLFALMLADWLSSLDASPCVLADGDPLRGTLSRLSGNAAMPATRTGALPDNCVVDNADALASEPGNSNGSDHRSIAAVARWLTEQAGKLETFIACVLVDDTSDADRASLDDLRSSVPASVCRGLVAVRNAGMAARFPTEADQRYANAGGWPTSKERRAWLDSGARELVFSKPPASLIRQVKGLGMELTPNLLRNNALWLLSRQQFLRWRRDFADRAARALEPF